MSSRRPFPSDRWRRARSFALASALSIVSACADDGTIDDASGTSSSGSGSTEQSASTVVDGSSSAADAEASSAETGSSAGSSSSDDATTDRGSTGDDSTTGIDVTGFESFRLSSAAGPCGPGADCDGFIELLASGLLRVEPFGEVGNPVEEVAISPEDFDAAVVVFADPALFALLDGPQPICKPPTDIFESMTAVFDGSMHEASTTFCDEAPIAAAREMAEALRMEYLP